MKEGVLLPRTKSGIEMWDFELSNCLRCWFISADPIQITEIIPISEEQVALRTRNNLIILNTTTSEIVSIPIGHGKFLTSNHKCQMPTHSSGSVQL